jgi:aerobic carbon-monoxide dehydrogenase medium subunit
VRGLFPRSFEYASPTSVEDAVALIGEYGEKAKFLAGGQSLIPIMKLRLASPQVVVDLNRVRDLSGIREEGDAVVIGSMTRHREVEHSRLLRDPFPLLSEAAALLADPLVRNRGTVGGSLAHADPASDWGTTLLALGAELTVRGPKGNHTIPIDAFFKDSFTTALAPNELLTQIRLAKPGAHSGSAYTKLKRKTGDFATVAVAAVLTLDAGSVARHVRIAPGGVGPTPLRASRAERALEGKPADSGALAQAAHAASEDARPTEDLRGSIEYKRAMVEVYAHRALVRAVERAQGRKG